MNKKPNIPTYKGRSMGIVILTGAQLLVGAIHTMFGLLLFTFETSFFHPTVAYNFYTVIFGLSVLFLAVLIWQRKKTGWIGTIAVSIFVTAVDLLAVLNLPTIPGTPKFAAPTEIGYSVLIISYLSLSHVKKIFSI